MNQTRLYFIAQDPRAGELYTSIELEFEEDGYPLAKSVVDGSRGIHEISVYSSQTNIDTDRLRALFRSDENYDINCEILPDIDWVAKSLEGLKPVRAGRFLVHGSHDRQARRIGDLAIEIDAGQAFGTGHHGTTAGCLQMIERIVRSDRPANALDLGTGSAVLAIAIAKCTAIPVLASDIDHVATRVASANIRSNGVAARVRAITATGFDHLAIANSAPFDLIVANVLAGPLMKLAPAMARHTAPGGSVILSGILPHQRWPVIAAYTAQRYRHVKTIAISGWVTTQLMR